MALMRFDPFRDIDRLAEQALAGARTARSLPMEALRRGDQFIIALDVPGITSEDIDVTIERNVIEITARRRPLRQDGDQLIVDERPQGEFRRQLFLGDNLDANQLSAAVADGVLTLTVPVSAQNKPRKVAIGTAGEAHETTATASAPRQTVDA
ncbi:Hsp20/alpha crystallin family protein [Mycolicibacterium sp. 050158]|uniref:Hsp20/alpha crystallin family protein n=1 Tax=Mycolicibacterium sp. 050158 TaxID=3090602 RepID=UPI00299D1E2E|nr:Hsp20 family protein [Mycolicibacterium sp. 050158]MDX1888804.1 Hsp20 family protein [Mycolicibacterium sp. 050158]